MKFYWKHYVALFLLVITYCYLLILSFQDPKITQDYGLVYFIMYYLPKIIPLTIIGFYYFQLFNLHKINKAFSFFSWVALALAAVTGIVLLTGALIQLPQEFFFGVYNWSYEAPLLWIVCFLTCWILTKLETGSATAALTFSAIAISVGGNLHEFIFIFLNVEFYVHRTYPLFVATPLICGVFLVLLMREFLWKRNLAFTVALITYIVFTIVYATLFNPNVGGALRFPNLWIQRLPTVLLLIAIPTGFKKKVKV